MTNNTLFCGIVLVVIGLYAYFVDAPGDIKEENAAIEVENKAIREKNEDAKSKDPKATLVEEKRSKGTKVSITSAIPAMFGAVFLLLVGLVIAKPDFRKHAMHAGAVVGVIGVIGGLYYPLTHLPFDWGKAGTRAGVLMTVTCLIYVALAVYSFIEAKKAREAAKPA